MANRYWVGDTGDWNQTAHWSTTSGGAGGAAVPTAFDVALIDTNSFSADNQVITIPVNTTYSVGGIIVTAPEAGSTLFISGDPDYSTGTYLNVYSTFDLRSTFTLKQHVLGDATDTGKGGVVFAGNTALDYDQNNATLQADLSFEKESGGTMGTATIDGDIIVTNGSTTGYDVNWTGGHLFFSDSGSVLTCESVGFYGTPLGGDMTITTSLTINASSVSIYYDIATGSTLALSGCTFNMTDTVSNGFAVDSTGGSVTIGTMNYTTATSGNNYFQGQTAITVTNFNVTNGTDVRIYEGMTLTVTNLTITGLNGNPSLLRSTTTTDWNLVKTSGSVVALNAQIRDCNASGGASFIAVGPGADQGNNTGWTFMSNTSAFVAFF